MKKDNAMYVVIFRATLSDLVVNRQRERAPGTPMPAGSCADNTLSSDVLGDDYQRIAVRMRERAMKQFGCLDFVSMCEGGQELAVSYWADEASIRAWHSDKEHQAAQDRGKQYWYKDYSVEILSLARRYQSDLTGGTI